MGKRKQTHTSQSIAAAVEAAMARFYHVPFYTDFGFKRAWIKCKLFPRRATQVVLSVKDPILKWRTVRNEFSGSTFANKNGIFDVICKDEREAVYILEMQARNNKFLIPRLVYYTSEEYCNLVPKGKTETSFGNLPPVYCICFIKGKQLPGKDYHQIFLLKNQHGEILFPGIEIHFLELGKFPILRKNWQNVKTDEEKLLYTMKYAHTINGKNPAVVPNFWKEDWISDVVTELELAKLTPQERAMVNMALVKEASIREADKLRVQRVKERTAKKKLKEGKVIGHVEGKAIGLEEGKTIGLEEGKTIGKEQAIEELHILTIRNLTKQDFPVEGIAGVINVLREKVLKIQQQLLKEPEIIRLLTKGSQDNSQIALQLEVSPFLVELVRIDLQKQKVEEGVSIPE